MSAHTRVAGAQALGPFSDVSPGALSRELDLKASSWDSNLKLKLLRVTSHSAVAVWSLEWFNVYLTFCWVCLQLLGPHSCAT